MNGPRAPRAALAYPLRRSSPGAQQGYVALAMEKPLTRSELETFHRRLLDELAGHARDVEAAEAGALQPSGGERNQDVDEPVEEAALDVELTTLAAQDRLGYEVHEALERIADGSYGRCEDCARPIGRRRLEFVPWARRCAACERKGKEEATR